MNIRKGIIFTHAHWRDESGNRLRCIVTCVRAGLVYYRRTDSKKARDYFPVSQWYEKTHQVISG